MPFPREVTKKRELYNYKAPKIGLAATLAYSAAFFGVMWMTGIVEYYKLPAYRLDPNDPERIIYDLSIEDRIKSKELFLTNQADGRALLAKDSHELYKEGLVRSGSGIAAPTTSLKKPAQE